MCKWSTSAWGDLLLANFCRPMSSKEDNIHVLTLVVGWAFSRHSESRLPFIPGRHFVFTKGYALCSFSKCSHSSISFCLNKSSLVHTVQGSFSCKAVTDFWTNLMWSFFKLEPVYNALFHAVNRALFTCSIVQHESMMISYLVNVTDGATPVSRPLTGASAEELWAMSVSGDCWGQAGRELSVSWGGRVGAIHWKSMLCGNVLCVCHGREHRLVFIVMK